MKAFLFAALLLGFPLLAQESSVPPTDQITTLAKAFIVDLNLGDYDKMADLVRPEDQSLLLKLQTEESEEMLKIINLPQLAQIRSALAEETAKANVFPQPQIAADGQTATVTMSMVPSETEKFLETKMIYEIFAKETLRAQQNGTSPPNLEIIKAEVQGPISLLHLKIELNAHEILNETPPPMNFEKTVQGWRMNIQQFFAKKP
jgi:hypothetical protein